MVSGKWVVMYLVVYGMLMLSRHFVGFEAAVISGVAWLLANQEDER